MLTTKQPVFRRFRHATVPLSTLADGPKPFTLLGEAIVLFLGPDGAPAALRDRCRHRTAKLSRGWCEDGRLVCGYHGWTYDTAGRVVRIPQHEPDRPIPPDYRTTAYRCVARRGCAWVALEEPIAPIPDVPEFDDAGFRTICRCHERWETSPLRALANSFDNAHFSFVHRATFGVAAQPKPSRCARVETDTGVFAETVIEAANRRARDGRPVGSRGLRGRAGMRIASSEEPGPRPVVTESSMRIPSRTLQRGLASGAHAASRRERAQRAIAAVAVSIATGARTAPDEPGRAPETRKPPGA